MMEYAERIAGAVKLIQGIYNDVTRNISEVKSRIRTLEMRDNLSQREERELEQMQFKLDELEETLNYIDQVLCMLEK